MINPLTGTDAPTRSYVIKRGTAFMGDTMSFESPEDTGAEFWDGYAVLAQWRSTPDGDLLHQFSLGAAVTTTAEGRGLLTISLSMQDSDTADLPAGDIIGDVRLSSDLCPTVVAVTLRAKVLLSVSHP